MKQRALTLRRHRMSETYVRTPEREEAIPQTFGEEPSLRLIDDGVITPEWNHPAKIYSRK